MRHTWCVAAFPPDPRAINRRPVGAWRVTDRKEFLHVSSTFLADPSRSRFNGRVRKKKEEKGEEQREREREREREETRGKFHWGGEMSHDDASRFMRARASLRGVNEFPLFLFLQEGERGQRFSSSAIGGGKRGEDLNVRRNVSSPRERNPLLGENRGEIRGTESRGCDEERIRNDNVVWPG